MEKRFTKDELLTNITIYWVTQTLGSSVRMYYENQRNNWVMGKDEQIPAPAAVAVFPGKISRPPREWAERSYNVCRWTVQKSRSPEAIRRVAMWGDPKDREVNTKAIRRGRIRVP